MRQVERLELGNRLGNIQFCDAVQVQIGKNILELRHNGEVSGGLGKIQGGTAMARAFGDFYLCGAQFSEGFRYVACTTMGCVLITVPGSNSTRFGFSTMRFPRIFSLWSATTR